MGFTSKQHSYIKRKKQEIVSLLYVSRIKFKVYAESRKNRYLAGEVRDGRIGQIVEKSKRYQRYVDRYVEYKANKEVQKIMLKDIDEYLSK